jgi:hypothetical protein
MSWWIITIEDFSRNNKGKKGRDLRYIKHYVTVDTEDRMEVFSERFNEITHISINLLAFKEEEEREM